MAARTQLPPTRPMVSSDGLAEHPDGAPPLSAPPNVFDVLDADLIYRRVLCESGSTWLDAYAVKAVDLDDVLLANKVEILATSGLSALCPPDAHHFDETPAFDHAIARPNMTRDCDLSRGTRLELCGHGQSLPNRPDITPIVADTARI